MRVWLGLIAFLLVAVPATAETVYRGEQTIWQDTVWSGEVLVDGILTVAAGITLEIRPGTTVRFTRFDSNGDNIGEHELFVQGRILALGEAAAPIRFVSAQPHPRPGDWGAINMMASEEENRFVHCRFEGAYRGFHAHFARARLDDCDFTGNVRAVQFQEAQVELHRCRLVDNCNGLQFRDSRVTLADVEVRGGYWGVRAVQSEVTMRDCRIRANLVNGANLRDCTLTMNGCRIVGNRRGLYLQQGTATVEGSEFVGNSEHGIYLEDCQVTLRGNLLAGNGRAGLKWLAARGELRGNRFAGNGEYALVNAADTPVDARGNDWGSRDVATIAALIRDGADLVGVGVVAAGEPL